MKKSIPVDLVPSRTMRVPLKKRHSRRYAWNSARLGDRVILIATVDGYVALIEKVRP